MLRCGLGSTDAELSAWSPKPVGYFSVFYAVRRLLKREVLCLTLKLIYVKMLHRGPYKVCTQSEWWRSWYYNPGDNCCHLELVYLEIRFRPALRGIPLSGYYRSINVSIAEHFVPHIRKETSTEFREFYLSFERNCFPPFFLAVRMIPQILPPKKSTRASRVMESSLREGEHSLENLSGHYCIWYVCAIWLSMTFCYILVIFSW